jgi:hypothetical protein
LEAQSVAERLGNGRMLQDLETREPELASYLMECCSQLYGRLMDLGGPTKRTQQFYRRMERLVLICLHAQHEAQRELWDPDSPIKPATPPTQKSDPPAQP